WRMCIALITTAHPSYPLILINNRDEYLTRPTAPAAWWDEPHSHVLGGRDLQRNVRGTWLGITKQGRVAVLTNFREEGQNPSGVRSRGGIVNAFLTTPPDSQETTEQFAKRLVEEEGVKDVGGFSLVFGRVRSPTSRRNDGLAIVSNRTPNVQGLTWIANKPGLVHGLSNSHYGDQTWPKVVRGQRLLEERVRESAEADEDRESLIRHLFDLLHTDTLPSPKNGEDLEVYLRQLRNSIFIPAIGGQGNDDKPGDSVAAANNAEP
ncbi:hypothetical protein B0A49_13599, partial [Cryomyces minteri]